MAERDNKLVTSVSAGKMDFEGDFFCKNHCDARDEQCRVGQDKRKV